MAQKTSKIILIVGGASGIGKATAQRLVANDCRLIVADKNEEKLKSCAAEITGPAGSPVWFLPLDLTDRAGVQDVIRQIKSKMQQLDAVVVSAGIHSTYPIEYLSDELIHNMIAVNLTGHIQFVRDVLPVIKDGGRMIGLSSIAACVGVPMSSLYSASKSGLEGFYESLSTEIAYRNIKAVLIHPGNVNTGFNETGNDYIPTGHPFIDDSYKRVVSRIDSRYGIDPQDVARVIEAAIWRDHPKFCYVVGPNALKAHWAKKLLGRELALKLMAKFFGFN